MIRDLLLAVGAGYAAGLLVTFGYIYGTVAFHHLVRGERVPRANVAAFAVFIGALWPLAITMAWHKPSVVVHDDEEVADD